MAANKVERLAHKQILRIHGTATVFVFGDLDAPAVFPEMIGVVGVRVGLVDEAEELVEAFGGGRAGAGKIAEAPFADGARGIANLLKCRRKGAVGSGQGSLLLARMKVCPPCNPVMNTVREGWHEGAPA